MKKTWLVLTFSVLNTIVSSCVTAGELLTTQVNVKLVNSPSPSKWGVPLETGQIVVTESPIPINTLYLLLYPQYSPFIHVGIVDVSGGDVGVYEASGTYKLGMGSAPPTDNISGHVRRISLDDYLQENGGTATFYQPPAGVDMSKVLAYAQHHVDSKTPFDPYFNYRDRSSLYCSEFVAAAFEAGGVPAYSTVPMKPNRSTQVVMAWLKVNDRDILPVDRLTSTARWLGTISQTYTLTELKVDRTVKAELYQRFTDNQKLGNILAWEGMNVAFQPPVAQFKEQAFAAFDKDEFYTAEQVLHKVGELADESLGDFDAGNISECKIDFSHC